jgi:hypothetical protein
MSKNYVHEPQSIEQILEANDATKRTLTALYQQLEEKGIDTEKIKESIQYSCQGVMQMLSNMVSHNSIE